jgi:hypothetical protein
MVYCGVFGKNIPCSVQMRPLVELTGPHLYKKFGKAHKQKRDCAEIKLGCILSLLTFGRCLSAKAYTAAQKINSDKGVTNRQPLYFAP